uniref:Transmembrane protein with EGF-like and two follistatin-like domains 2a n=1 Tax=Echeneis naucrates TaxID=173247 RepID=A0A665VEU2_ECHNA
MGPSVAAQAPLKEPRRLRQCGGTAGGWLRITLVSFLATLPVEQLRAFPSSLSDCQTPTGWNCSGFDDRDTDLFLCDTNTCKFDGECLRIGNMVTCICDFKCNNDYAPVCGSNNQNYQNECFLRRDACKQQSEVLIMSEGDCPADAGSGSGDDGEGSAEAGQKETSTCDICQFGAECDVDAEDVWCVCNIDCSHISFNPVCASDGRSYDNPCQVKEASCQKQERIEVNVRR